MTPHDWLPGLMAKLQKQHGHADVYPEAVGFLSAIIDTTISDLEYSVKMLRGEDGEFCEFKLSWRVSIVLNGLERLLKDLQADLGSAPDVPRVLSERNSIT